MPRSPSLLSLSLAPIPATTLTHRETDLHMRAYAARHYAEDNSVLVHGLWHKHNMGKTANEAKKTEQSLAGSSGTWECAKCTCKNVQSSTKCQACGEPAPPKVQRQPCT